MSSASSEIDQFRISIHYRDSDVSFWRDAQMHWQSQLGYGAVDSIFGLIEHLRVKRFLLIGRRTAEKMVLELGSAAPMPEELSTTVRGRDLKTSLPNGFELTSIEMREVMKFNIQSLIFHINQVFSGPEISEDGAIFHPRRIPAALRPALGVQPILLTGEFGNLYGLDQLIQDKLGLPVISSLAG